MKKKIDLLIILLLIFSLIPAFAIKGSLAATKTKVKKAVMIIASKNFRDEELKDPKVILEKEGINVTVASSSLKESKGMLGATASPDILLEKVKVDDYDAVVFIGGTGAAEYWNNQTAHEIAKKAIEKNKVVGAICIAPVTLSNAGILKGKKATVWESESKKLKDGGADYTGKSVEVDGKIITANGPTASKEFGKALANALK